jgi:hypothetical protein
LGGPDIVVKSAGYQSSDVNNETKYDLDNRQKRTTAESDDIQIRGGNNIMRCPYRGIYAGAR